MMLQTSAEEYISEIEKSINKKCIFRAEIISLLKLSQGKNMGVVVEDVLFVSKFLSQAVAVLKREGMASEITKPLQTEFKLTLEKFHSLLHTLVKDADEPLKQHFVSRFLSMKPDCMENLLTLARELSWVKNYQLDNAN
ncbi:MAG: hypothetical protein HY960_11585 [Ignavibacteriae bacterium]|nr:hypothetical protein [Ignavibacteriota bacterium]